MTGRFSLCVVLVLTGCIGTVLAYMFLTLKAEVIGEMHMIHIRDRSIHDTTTTTIDAFVRNATDDPFITLEDLAAFKKLKRQLLKEFKKYVNTQTVTETTSTTPDPALAAFVPNMNASERAILDDLLQIYTNQMASHNLTYFMYGGTLLGSYRHHDIIPWDDDVDLIMPVTQRDAAYDALRKLGRKYIVRRAGPRLKFFSIKSYNTTGYSWRWPYLDICFYNENDTHLWDASSEFSNYIYPKNLTFPLHQRPFGNLYMNSPYDAYATLLLTYTSASCQTYYYSHKYEGASKTGRHNVACRKLKNKVPFVYRSPAQNGVRETLRLGDRILQSVIVEEPPYAVSQPFIIGLVRSVKTR